MNKRQIEDNEKCEKLQNKGIEMDCMKCNCNGCLAHEPIDYESGLQKALEITLIEIEIAKEINPQMAFGMRHIIRMFREELEKYEPDNKLVIE